MAQQSVKRTIEITEQKIEYKADPLVRWYSESLRRSLEKTRVESRVDQEKESRII
jgi:hypothetical protein